MPCRKSNRLQVAGYGGVLLILALTGCANTLAAPESAAFAKLATADRDAFTNLSETEAQSGLGLSQALLHENLGRVTVTNCGSEASDDCILTYTLSPASYRLTASAYHTRALIGAIARYSEQMAALAEAKDLADIKAKTAAAGNSLKLLTALLPPAGLIAGPLIDAAIFIGNASLRQKRRRAMLTVATAAQPIIELAARALGDAATSFKADITKDAAAAVLETQRAILDSQNRERGRGTQPRAPGELSDELALMQLRQQRAADMASLSQEAQALNAARHLPTDFNSLATAHRALTNQLNHPGPSLETAMADIKTFLSIIDEARSASKKL